MTDAAQFHKRKLATEAVGNTFYEKQPPRNFDEYFDRTKEAASGVAQKAETGARYVGNGISKFVEDHKIKEKFTNLFK